MSRPVCENVDRANADCGAGVPPARCSRDGCATRIVTLGVVLGVLAVVCAPGRVRGEDRLYNQTPYDRVTLDEHNDNKVLKLVPLNLEAMPKESAEIEVRQFDEPDKILLLKWSHVAKDENGNYTIESHGKDGIDSTNLTLGEKHDYESDLVLYNGLFVAAPE